MLPVLWLVALLCGIALWRDPTFDRQILSWARRPASPWRRIALFLAIGTSAILAAILWLAPELVFDTPREQPLAWLVMLIAYPLLSVIPQEFVWRTFFMHRYRDLFGSRHAMVAASALTFGLGHIIFLHPLPVVLTAIAGVAFGYTYLRARSLWPVVFEHALYGCMLFTVGLGSYFTMSQAVGAPGILP